MPGKFALLIGNSHYTDSALPDLTKSRQDVEDLAQVLRDPDIGAFDDVKPLLDQPADTVRREIARFYADRDSKDLLLLYFTGHGARGERDDLYLAVKDTEKALLNATAISAEFITTEIDKSRSKQHLLIAISRLWTPRAWPGAAWLS